MDSSNWYERLSPTDRIRFDLSMKMCGTATVKFNPPLLAKVSPEDSTIPHTVAQEVTGRKKRRGDASKRGRVRKRLASAKATAAVCAPAVAHPNDL